MPMRTKSADKEGFLALEWAPAELKLAYAPSHMEGEGCGSSPVVCAFRNGTFHFGTTGPWCIGSACWIIVTKGPVMVVGLDLDACFKDSPSGFVPVSGL